jgi:hypothetical protein
MTPTDPFAVAAARPSRDAAFAGGRRRLLSWAPALLVPGLLAACGGGGDAPVDGPLPPNGPGAGLPEPRIAHFGAASLTIGVGDRARLEASFSHGTAHIEPAPGPVLSGAAVDTAPLDRDTRFSLVVRGTAGREVRASLDVRVQWRNRYATLTAAFSGSQHGAVALLDGRVLVVGGSRGTGMLSPRVDVFDPNTGSVTPLTTLRDGRGQPLLAALPDGDVLVVGGETAGLDSRLVERIAVARGAVSAAGQLSVGRVDAAALALPGGRVLVTGGITAGEGAALGVSRSAELWEPSTQTFRRLGAVMHTSRASHTMTLLPDGRVLVVGGHTQTAQPLLAEVFDPVTERFDAPTGLMPGTLAMRAQHLATAHPDGSVLVLGGERSGADVSGVEPMAEVLRFDPSSQRFQSLPPLAQARTLVRGAVTPAGEVLLFGGQTHPLRHSADAERYDPRQGGQAIAPLDRERAWHSVTRLPNGRIAVIGGETRGGHLAEDLLVYL